MHDLYDKEQEKYHLAAGVVCRENDLEDFRMLFLQSWLESNDVDSIDHNDLEED